MEYTAIYLQCSKQSNSHSSSRPKVLPSRPNPRPFLSHFSLFSTLIPHLGVRHQQSLRRARGTSDLPEHTVVHVLQKIYRITRTDLVWPPVDRLLYLAPLISISQP